MNHLVQWPSMAKLLQRFSAFVDGLTAPGVGRSASQAMNEAFLWFPQIWAPNHPFLIRFSMIKHA